MSEVVLGSLMGWDCWSLCWGLVGRGTLNSLWDYRPDVSSFVGLVVETCQLAVCATRLLWRTRSVCSNLNWWSQIDGKSWVTFSLRELLTSGEAVEMKLTGSTIYVSLQK